MPSLIKSASSFQGSWVFSQIRPLGLSQDGFIRLLPGSPSAGNMLFISYRTAIGCDAELDPQFTNKVRI
jgi:hypothetical protein